MQVAGIQQAIYGRPCGIASVPRELVTHIFTYLEPKDLATTLAVCRAWFQLVNASYLWGLEWQVRYGDQISLPENLPPAVIRRLLGLASPDLFDFFDAVMGMSLSCVSVDRCVYRNRRFYTSDGGTALFGLHLSTGNIRELERPPRAIRTLSTDTDYLYGVCVDGQIVRWKYGTGCLDQRAIVLEGGSLGRSGVSLVGTAGDQLILARPSPDGIEFHYVEFTGPIGRAKVLGTWSDEWETGWIAEDAIYVLFKKGLLRWPLPGSQMRGDFKVQWLSPGGSGTSALAVDKDMVIVLRPDGLLQRFQAHSLDPVGTSRRLGLQTPIHKMLPLRQGLLAVDIVGRVFLIQSQTGRTTEVCKQGYDVIKKHLALSLIQVVTTPP